MKEPTHYLNDYRVFVFELLLELEHRTVLNTNGSVVVFETGLSPRQYFHVLPCIWSHSWPRLRVWSEVLQYCGYVLWFMLHPKEGIFRPVDRLFCSETNLICYSVAFYSWFSLLSQGNILKGTKMCWCKSHVSKTVHLRGSSVSSFKMDWQVRSASLLWLYL